MTGHQPVQLGVPGYKYYGGRVKNRYHRVRVTLVDNFTSTPNPTRTRYFWANYRA